MSRLLREGPELGGGGGGGKYLGERVCDSLQKNISDTVEI